MAGTVYVMALNCQAISVRISAVLLFHFLPSRVLLTTGGFMPAMPTVAAVFRAALILPVIVRPVAADVLYLVAAALKPALLQTAAPIRNPATPSAVL